MYFICIHLLFVKFCTILSIIDSFYGVLNKNIDKHSPLPPTLASSCALGLHIYVQMCVHTEHVLDNNLSPVLLGRDQTCNPNNENCSFSPLATVKHKSSVRELSWYPKSQNFAKLQAPTEERRPFPLKSFWFLHEWAPGLSVNTGKVLRLTVARGEKAHFLIVRVVGSIPTFQYWKKDCCLEPPTWPN